MNTKIVTIPINVPQGTAANTVVQFAQNLKPGDPSFNKVVGFGIAIQNDGGVDFNVSLEPVSGKPLIDPVSKEYLRIGANTKPDDRLLSVDFPLDNVDTVVKITPRANTASAIVAQAVFLLKK